MRDVSSQVAEHHLSVQGSPQSIISPSALGGRLQEMGTAHASTNKMHCETLAVGNGSRWSRHSPEVTLGSLLYCGREAKRC